MSKAGFILYGAKGKIGNIVAQKGKSGTSLREKVDPSNPKSQKQMTQRAKFANAIKLYRSAKSNLFKFAFEDKNSNESDYNAFVRHNANIGCIFTRESYKNKNFPAICSGTLFASGSLNSAAVSLTDDVPSVALNSAPGDITSLGALAEQLIATYDLAEDDIVTVIQIVSEVSDINDTPSNPSKWKISQFKLSTADTRKITDVNSDWDVTSKVWSVAKKATTAAGYAVIFSRQTSDGLLVGDAILYNNSVADAIVEASKEDVYRASALESWGASQSTILQGSLA